MNEQTIEETINSQEFSDAMIKQREKQYEELIERLMKNGFNRRNAKKYIESVTRKQIKKFNKAVKKAQKQPKIYIEPEKDLDIIE